jgi:NAD(P)-dependent dehydrogenase (short-subunit alcohol dehydrogenase family)
LDVTLSPVETPGIYGLVGDDARAKEQLKARLTKSIPLGRMGHVDEVAATALHLASDQSSFTTGSELFVDGGLNQI